MPKKKRIEKHVHSKAGIKQKSITIPWWWLLLILIITFLAYLPSLQGGFVWDDDKYIENNPLITSIDLDALFSNYVMGNYHPITMLVYAIEYSFFGLDATGYHLVNLLIHLLNVLLVFYALFLLSNNLTIALLASIFFGIHPLHVESVAWASELKDLLYSFFFLASYIFYLKYINEPKRKFYYFSLILFLFSLLSKGMAVSLPVVLLLTDYFKGRKFTKQTILEKLPYFILAVIFGIVAVYAQKSTESIQDIARFPFLYRIVFASFGFISYIFKLILPIQLSAFYPYPIKGGEALPGYYYLFPLLLFALAAIVIYSVRFTKKILFGIGFFAVTVFLVLQLLPVGDAVMADRYSYIPSIGLFYLAGEGFYWLWTRKKKKMAYIVAGLASIFFFTQTYARCSVWKNGITLWTDVIGKHPTVAVAYNNRGGTLMNEKNFGEALADYDKAIELRPNYYDAYNNRGILLKDMQRYEEALKDYNKAIEFGPNHPEVYNNRGLLMMDLKRNKDALADFNKAIELQPNYSQAYYNRGLLAMNEGRNDQALKDYSIAISFNPYYIEAYINRGVIFHTESKFEEALTEYNRALELQPAYPQIYYNRGLVMMALKRNEEAISNFSKTIELQNDYPGAYYNRGMTFFQTGKKDLACQDLQMATKLGYQGAAEAVVKNCQ